MKKTFKTLLAFMLVCIMAVGLMGTMAFAADEVVGPENWGTYSVGAGSITLSPDTGKYITGVTDKNGDSVKCSGSVDSTVVTINETDNAPYTVTVDALPASVSCTGASAQTSKGTVDFGSTYAAVADETGHPGDYEIKISAVPAGTTHIATYAVLSNGVKIDVSGMVNDPSQTISPIFNFSLLSIYKYDNVQLPAALDHDGYVALAGGGKIDVASPSGLKASATVSAENDNYTNIKVFANDAELDASEYAVTSASYTPTTTALAIKAPSPTVEYTGKAAVVPSSATPTYTGKPDCETVDVKYQAITAVDASATPYTGVVMVDTANTVVKHGEINVTKFYTITTTDGDLTITKLPITFDGDATIADYDAAAHSPDAKVTVGALAEGHKITAAFDKSATNVSEGTVASKLTSVVIKDASDNDVSGNYTIALGTAGSITIKPVPLTITAKDAPSTEYTGNKITYSSADISKATVTGLKGSDALTAIAMSSEGTSVGSYPVKVSSYTISSGNDNYAVTLVNGEMKITSSSTIKGTITVTFGGTKAFDGAALPSYYTVSIDTDAKNAGVASVKVEPISTTDPVLGFHAFTKVMGESDVKITPLKADGTPYTAPLNIAVISGEVSITKLPLTITPSSVSKYYDGLPFVGEINAGKALAGTTINVTAKAKPYKGGFYDDKFVPGLGEHDLKVVESSVKIINSLGQDVSDSFDITYKDAKLTVKASIGSANYSKSAGGTVTINCTMPNSLLAYIMVDGTKLTLGDDYTINKSVESTVITFKNSFLKTLNVGEHSVLYNYGDAGTINARLTVSATGATTSTQAAQTGDNSNIILWVVILAICLAGAVAVAVVLVRQKKHNQIEG